jgi:hypothetical protein
MSEHEIQSLIFMPGFRRTAITGISDRGVGMDVAEQHRKLKEVFCLNPFPAPLLPASASCFSQLRVCSGWH